MGILDDLFEEIVDSIFDDDDDDQILIDDFESDRIQQLERENQKLKEKLTAQKTTKSSSVKQQKKVLYQCRYCGLKSVRNATDGAPTTTAKCPNHPRGWCKGVHSYMRTYL